MKRQAIILIIIYLIIMLLGAIWCQLPFDFNNDIKQLIIKSLIFGIASYGLFIIFVILKKTRLINKLLTRFRFIVTYINYLYLIVFLVEAMIGLVMVFVFKEYLYAYTFLPVLTALHATKLSKDLLDNYHVY